MNSMVVRLVRTLVTPRTSLVLSSKRNRLFLYKPPVGWVLGGYFFNWVPGDDFYLYAVAQGSYIFAKDVSLAVSARLRNPRTRSQRWSFNGNNVEFVAELESAITEGEGLLKTLGTLDGYIQEIERRLDPNRLNPLFQEQVVYGRIVLGIRDDDAMHTLTFLRNLSEARRGDHPKFLEVFERVQLVLNLVEGRESPFPQFQEWRTSTLKEIGVPPRDWADTA